MGYKIQDTDIWSNGELQVGNYIDAQIVNDNLKDNAQFYWQISNVVADEEGDETKTPLTNGNVAIFGESYIEWGLQADINLAAYQYICAQLNLQLIEG